MYSNFASDETRPRNPRATGDGGLLVILVALSMIVLLVAVAFAVDLGLWLNTGSRAQRAADAAALAAVAELVNVENTTGDRAAAEAAAIALAGSIAAQNGFDASDPDVTVSVNFSVNATGADEARVDIVEGDLPLFFSAVVTDGVSSSRDATAALNHCGASCAPAFVLPPGITSLVDAGTGGDGYEPTVAGTKIFNIFHHQGGNTLVCTEMVTEELCNVGGDPNYYPLEAYSGMLTNYTPKLAAIDTRLYFIVQTTNAVGLGCWSSVSHSTCAGFGNPWPLASYGVNAGKHGGSRMDGPEVVGSRLFIYGDDNKMYCYDAAAAAGCSGYPKNTALAGVHDATRNNPPGFAGGIVQDGIQFDMELALDGKIYLSLDEVQGTTWLHCWDTVTNASCASFGTVSTAGQRPFMFLTFNTSGVVDGVCAYAGKGGGKGNDGHECFSLLGSSRGAMMPWAFTKDTGEQPAHAVTSAGHTRTFFPFRSQNKAECWDWTTGAECAISASNWAGLVTKEYAYVSDGDLCIYALGHEGFLFSFSIDDGQYPCAAGGGVNTSIYPCTCSDGITALWTALVLTPDTDLTLFDSFEVTIKYADGTIFFTGDLVGASETWIDLSSLNNQSPPPTSMDLRISGYVTDGSESVVFAFGNTPGVALLPGILPVLVD